MRSTVVRWYAIGIVGRFLKKAPQKLSYREIFAHTVRSTVIRWYAIGIMGRFFEKSSAKTFIPGSFAHTVRQPQYITNQSIKVLVKLF